MNATETLDNFLSVTGLGEDPGCLFVGKGDVSAPEKHVLEWGSKIGADAVVLQRMNVTGSVFPLAYFRTLETAEPAAIAEAHRLAWNMGRAPLLFVVLPGKVRAYSSYEAPRPRRRDRTLDDQAGLIATIDLLAAAERVRQETAAFRRAELLSGRFWEQNQKRFSLRNRVEKRLLENLHDIRSKLIDAIAPGAGSPSKAASIVHGLLGRAIFIQYLYDRKDKDGYRAFPNGFFSEYVRGAGAFPDVLVDKAATYRLFECLEGKFNGDIFPVGDVERDIVGPDQLKLLGNFLRGDITLRTRQRSFWPYYSFDAIPIEFISNMYEEFFHYQKEEQDAAEGKRKRGARAGTHYTPHRLVEFILDEVLPWEGTDTNIRILDPACGSGIFLVESYRRLISRWQQANPEAKPDVGTLKALLTNNLYGIDSNLEAVRVAAFSLYLTMCDYLEPRYVWANVKFPALRGRNLRDRDFLAVADSPPGEQDRFDLVVGNPPWESRLSGDAEAYRQKRNRPVGDKQIAQVFLWAAPELCKKTGKIALIAPSKGLLFNASGPNKEFRRRFFEAFKVNVIVNFSALRRNLFSTAVGPAAPIIYQPVPPDNGHEIVYCCPKPCNSPEDGWHYVIESHDICRLPWRDAVNEDLIWKTAMWGGPRDWELVRKLTKLTGLGELAAERGWTPGEGFIVGTRDRKKADWLTGKPYVSPDALQPFTVDEEGLPVLEETLFYRAAKTVKEIFLGPHVLVRQSPKAGCGFIAALLEGNAVFPQSVLGLAGPRENSEQLGAVCAALATDICTYFAMMTSSRWLVERDELTKEEVMAFPVPNGLRDGALGVPCSQLQAASRSSKARAGLVGAIAEAYGLSRAERMLIRDAVTYTLDYFRRGAMSNAAKPVNAKILRAYAQTLCRSLQTSFGHDGSGSLPAKLYVGDGPMVVLEVMLLPAEGSPGPEIHRAANEMTEALKTVDKLLLEKRSCGVFMRRDVHVYETDRVYVVKRNQRRLWTMSVAMREADEIYAEIMSAWGRQAWG